MKHKINILLASLVAFFSISLVIVMGIFAFYIRSVFFLGGIAYGKDAYNLSLQLDGGRFAPGYSDIKSYNFSATSAFALPNTNSLIKNGYDFESWYANSAKTVAQNSIPATTRGHKTFYAGYDLVNFSITYNTNGGAFIGINPNTDSTKNTTNIQKSTSITLPTRSQISSPAYYFNGWKDKVTFAAADFTGGSIDSAGLFISSATANFSGEFTLVSNTTYTLTGFSGGAYLVNYNLDGSFVSLKQVTSNKITNTGNYVSRLLFTTKLSTAQMTALSLVSDGYVSALNANTVGNHQIDAQYVEQTAYLNRKWKAEIPTSVLSTITTINFAAGMSNQPTGVADSSIFDVSGNFGGTDVADATKAEGVVKAYVQGNTLTLWTPSSTIYAPQDSTYLFGQGDSETYLNSITNINFNSVFNTKNVNDMSYFFNNCSSLLSLDVSDFNTTNVTTMFWMFRYCKKITTLDVSSFDTSKVTNMRSMFNKCLDLTTLNISNFDTSLVTEMGFMFNECEALTSLDLSHFNAEKVTSTGTMLTGMNSLKTLKAPYNIQSSISIALPAGVYGDVASSYATSITSANDSTSSAARYFKKGSMITANPNSGTMGSAINNWLVSGSNQIKVQFHDMANIASLPNNPTRTGYIFDGWYTSSTSFVDGNKVTESKSFSSNSTIYAK